MAPDVVLVDGRINAERKKFASGNRSISAGLRGVAGMRFHLHPVNRSVKEGMAAAKSRSARKNDVSAATIRRPCTGWRCPG